MLRTFSGSNRKKKKNKKINKNVQPDSSKISSLKKKEYKQKKITNEVKNAWSII